MLYCCEFAPVGVQQNFVAAVNLNDDQKQIQVQAPRIGFPEWDGEEAGCRRRSESDRTAVIESSSFFFLSL